MLKGLIKLLASLKMSLWLLLSLLFLLLAGAFIMPLRAEFQAIHSLPLFQWVTRQPLSATWWLWAAIGVVSLLAANTLFCSLDSLMRKKTVTQWLMLISPQIIHIGFLFVLLAHLMSAIAGFKGVAVVHEGTVLQLPDRSALQVRTIAMSLDPNGYLRDWAVDVSYGEAGRIVGEDRLMPNRPSFREGIGIYVKDLRALPDKAVLLEISREPGAPWALIGGVIFMIGTVTLLILRMKREAKNEGAPSIL